MFKEREFQLKECGCYKVIKAKNGDMYGIEPFGKVHAKIDITGRYLIPFDINYECVDSKYTYKYLRHLEKIGWIRWC